LGERASVRVDFGAIDFASGDTIGEIGLEFLVRGLDVVAELLEVGFDAIDGCLLLRLEVERVDAGEEHFDHVVMMRMAALGRRGRRLAERSRCIGDWCRRGGRDRRRGGGCGGRRRFDGLLLIAGTRGE
jgi:hypothetical protein